MPGYAVSGFAPRLVLTVAVEAVEHMVDGLVKAVGGEE